MKLIIIMVSNNNNNNGYFKCNFSRQHIALSYKNGVNIELGKTNR